MKPVYNLLEDMAAYVQLGLKQTLESYIELETSDCDPKRGTGDGPVRSYATRDGSMCSLIRIDGQRQLMGAVEFDSVVRDAERDLAPFLQRRGQEIDWWFSWDPEAGREEVAKLSRAMRSAGENLGMNIGPLVDERVGHMGKFIVREASFITVWTGPAILTAAEKKRGTKAVKAIKYPTTPGAQFPFSAIPELRSRHNGAVEAVAALLDGLGFKVEILEVHDGLTDIRSELFPDRANPSWRAMLPGDELRPRSSPEGTKDVSELLWPPLRHQLCRGMDAKEVNWKVCQIGSRAYQGINMTLLPQDPSSFQKLINKLDYTKTPFRASIRLGGDGMQGTGLRRLIALFFGWTSPDNQLVRKALMALEERMKVQTIVKWRMSVATWAPANDPELLDRRVAALTQAFEQWGTCQAASDAGDALDGVMSSALGVSRNSTAEVSPIPLGDALKMLPWHRYSSPYKAGMLWLRTPDGKLWPFQPGGSALEYTFDVLVGPPRKGKSLLMCELDFATILGSGSSMMPYISKIDIGFTSMGEITLLKELLPADRRHEVGYFRLKNEITHAINPFDTQLGFRQPIENEREFLRNLLMNLMTPAGKPAPIDGMRQLIGLVLNEVYRWKSDSGTNNQPNLYTPGLNRKVDEALAEHRVTLLERPLWWDVVDALFDARAIHEASLAQRYAVPVLGDCILAAKQPHVVDLLGKMTVGGGSAELVIDAFIRDVNSALDEYRVFGGPTQFDIGTDIRVCSLDLQDVAPTGGVEQEKQSTIMYMLARHVLVHHWWLDIDMPAKGPDRYLAYHTARVRDIREVPKRLSYDELHRTPRTGGVRPQIIRDVREGPKWNVQVAVASQMLEDFDGEMRELATATWILGAGMSAEAVNRIAEKFGLSDAAVNVVHRRLKGPGKKGAPLLLLLEARGAKYVQFLMNTVGPLELWALGTKPVDVNVRNRLYQRLEPWDALRVLSTTFPDGTAEDAVERKRVLREEQGISDVDAEGSILDEVVEDLYRRAMLMGQQAA